MMEPVGQGWILDGTILVVELVEFHDGTTRTGTDPLWNQTQALCQPEVGPTPSPSIESHES